MEIIFDGGLKMTTNCCLENAVCLLLSGEKPQLNNEYAFHNAHKGEDQNIDLSCGQHDDGVGI